MIIYKITNKINNKSYIGQTIGRLCDRWAQHNYNTKRQENKPLYNAMKKYGKENFKIEEIGGANNITELNYQEWLLIHTYDTLYPNGYNLREGGGNRGKNTPESIEKMSKSQKKWYKNNKSPLCKEVVNIKTKQKWVSAKECFLKNDIQGTVSGFRAKLIGKTGNDTDFRYVGMEEVFKKPKPGAPKQVINIKTSKSYKSAAECARQNNIKYGTLKDKLNGKRGNDTDFRYKNNQSVCKQPKPGAAKKVIDTKTKKIYKSAAQCARENDINYGTLKSMLSGHDKNNTSFKYVNNK